MQTIHYGSADGTIAGAELCSLFVHKAMMAPRSHPWRLLWATDADARTFVHAEGECSARYFRTMREAVAYGLRAYGETATRFID
jgi:hypothetical protein